MAGTAALDVAVRGAPAGWLQARGLDRYTPSTVFPLEAPVEMGLGGNGAAAARVLGRLGVHVHLNAPIGADAAGRLVRQWLTEAGVELVAPVGSSTNVAITGIDVDAKRLGTLQHVGPRIDWRRSGADGEAAWLLVALCANAPADDIAAVQDALGRFRRSGGRTAFDAGIAWTATAPPEALWRIWAEVDMLLGTVEELGHWTGEHGPEAVARAVLGRGPRSVVVKLGAEGAAYQAADVPFGHQPARAVERPGLTIGAGDCFNGALLATLARAGSLAEAVDAGQRVAAAVVAGGRGVLGWSGLGAMARDGPGVS